MWRRASSHLQTLATPWRRSAPHLLRQYTLQNRAFASITSSPYRKTSPLLSSQSDNVPTKKRVEDVMPIATGHEQKELEAELDVGLGVKAERGGSGQGRVVEAVRRGVGAGGKRQGTRGW
ncbi:putative Cytochrome c oxidase subunit 5B, mitochondrial [Cocos nucifera]|nr:putative Cytochrome c oxidase subunit 5B, mitochondrial [Cocos nucifera]